MTVADAIKRLDSIRRKHGEEVVVLFDCPRCGQSFEPDLAVPVVQPTLRIKAIAKPAAEV